MHKTPAGKKTDSQDVFKLVYSWYFKQGSITKEIGDEEF